MSESNQRIRVAVSGACGRMGQEVIKAVNEDANLELVAAIDVCNVGKDIGEIVENKACGVNISDNLKEAIKSSKAQSVVDFTSPDLVYPHTKEIIECGARPVIGTTGLSEAQLDEIKNLANSKKIGTLIAPNFAIGAVLMMMFAQKAAEYMDNAEIIETHHNKKKDAPSGTAIKTAQMMSEAQKKFGKDNCQEVDTIKGSRGGVTESNIHIHSVRLPGFVAHQEVIFGGKGQALTIRHDSFDRTSFMPGVVHAVKEIMKKEEFVYGLEKLL